MRVSCPNGGVHLTYCLNIHPGETWADNRRAIVDKSCAVRDALGGKEPFGLGLRLSADAAAELANPEACDACRDWLGRTGLYAFTVNAFPYGAFHGTRVKEGVYAPDWSSAARLAYTHQVAAILARLLPDGVPGSISTVPGTYRPWVDDARLDAILHNLLATAVALADLEERSGRHIALAIEPEPDCLWDSTQSVLDLFTDLLPNRALPAFARQTGKSIAQVEAMARRHLGVCLDTCHLSVLFDPPEAALRRLLAAGIAVPKVQVSAAPGFGTSGKGLAAAAAFVDACYLHQSCLRLPDGTLRRFPDLPEAVAAARHVEGGELRTHFHIPLVVGDGDGFASTRNELTPGFWDLVVAGGVPHVEVETYTFDVLPEALREMTVVDSIAGELAWTRRALEAAARHAGAVG